MYDRDMVMMTATTLLCAVIFVAALLWTRPVHGEQRTFYDAGGKVTGRAATDTQGTTTFYDARGNVVARESRPNRSKPK
jgi:YD repeat-containing protein